MRISQRFAEVAEEGDQGVGLVVGVEAGGVREDPDARLPDRLFLQAELCFRALEGGAVGADAHHREVAWLVLQDLACQGAGAGAQLVGSQLVRGRGGAGDDVRDAVAELQELVLRGRVEEVRGEPRTVQGGPEAVAGTAEVLLDGGGVEAGVDAAEEDVEVRRDDIGQRFARGGGDLGGRGPAQKFSARPPMYFFDWPAVVRVSTRYGEFSARASSRPRSSLMSIGR